MLSHTFLRRASPALLLTLALVACGQKAFSPTDAQNLSPTTSLSTDLSTGLSTGLSIGTGATEIVQQAEAASTITAPMKVYEKSSASGGRYVSTGTANAGSVSFLLQIPATGEYVLSARVKSPSKSKNSFLVKLDAGQATTWHLPILSAFGWTDFPATLNLTAGSHQLTVQGREAHTELDVIKLVPSPVAGTAPIAPPAPVLSPAPPPVGVLDPANAPAQNFDLSLWKLTLPVDANGGLSGVAAEVKSIASSYHKAPFFQTGSDGAMVMMAPVTGATTSGSHYPRSELRELTSAGTNAAWTASQGGRLRATLSVNELPVRNDGGKGSVVIGQIHGPDDELCRLYYDQGKLYFHDDKSGPDEIERQYILKSASGVEPGIPLNARFDYEIRVADSALTVTATFGGVVYRASEPISRFWSDKPLYFKVGAYVQVGKPGSDAGTTGSGRGQVSFYRLPPPSHP